MDAGHRPVERREDLRCVLAKRETGAREQVMSKIVAIFEALDNEEKEAERRRCAEKTRRELRPPDVGGANGERDRQAARHQSDGVRGAVGDLCVARALHERCELGSVPQHRVHDDREPARQSDLALRIVDRLAIAKAQSLSLSWPSAETGSPRTVTKCYF